MTNHIDVDVVQQLIADGASRFQVWAARSGWSHKGGSGDVRFPGLSDASLGGLFDMWSDFLITDRENFPFEQRARIFNACLDRFLTQKDFPNHCLQDKNGSLTLKVKAFYEYFQELLELSVAQEQLIAKSINKSISQTPSSSPPTF